MSTSTQQNAHLNSVHVCKARRSRLRHREELVDAVDVGVPGRQVGPPFVQIKPGRQARRPQDSLAVGVCCQCSDPDLLDASSWHAIHNIDSTAARHWTWGTRPPVNMVLHKAWMML